MPRRSCGCAASTNVAPVALVSPERQHQETVGETYPECRFHSFPAAEAARLKVAANEAGTTLNNLLLRQLFVTLGEWKQSQGDVTQESVLRITVPVNLRTAEDRLLPAANVVSLVCLDRKIGEIDEQQAFLEGIDQSVQDAQRYHWDWMLPATLGLMHRFPHQLAKAMERKRFSGSTFLSNIGPALPHCHLPRQAGKLVAGNVVVRDVQFMPVLRAHQGVSFGATTYANSLALSMQYDSRCIESLQAQAIFEGVISGLSKMAGTGEGEARKAAA